MPGLSSNQMGKRTVAAALTGAAVAASALALAACSSSSETSCHLATPASAMATHGSLEVRELRRKVVTIVTNADKELNSTLPHGDSGSINSDLALLGSNIIQMNSKLAALKYPPEYQAAALQMLAKSRSLAASLQSGQADTASGNALFGALDASQQFYKALGIPSVCTTTSGG
jgi:hypothetical protein